MEVRFKPLGILLILVIVASAAVFDGVDWSNARMAARDRQEYTTGSGNVVVLTSAAGRIWLQKQAEKFNQQHRGHIVVTVRYQASQKALSELLAGKEKPTMWAPGAADWLRHLGDQWPRSHHGQNVIDVTDESGYRAYLRTPLVFVTDNRKGALFAGFPLTAGALPPVWAGRAESAALGRPADTFRFACPDPELSDCGRMAIGTILTDYALRNGVSNDLDAAAKSSGFLKFLKDLSAKTVSDEYTKQGSAALLQAFVRDPKRYDLVAAYESDALRMAAKDPHLVVMYPSPTYVEEQSVALLSGASWVSPAQRIAARSFLDFLACPDSLHDGVESHFRPAHPTAKLTLEGELMDRGKQGFRQRYGAVDVLPSAAADDAARAWRTAMALPLAPYGVPSSPAMVALAHSHI